MWVRKTVASALTKMAMASTPAERGRPRSPSTTQPKTIELDGAAVYA
jgi:hypothetical protein